MLDSTDTQNGNLGTLVLTVREDGSIVLPAAVRLAFGIEEGSRLALEVVEHGLLIRSRDAIETYTPERRAEFLLSNAVSDAEYGEARNAVRLMGLNPDAIEHYRHKG